MLSHTRLCSDLLLDLLSSARDQTDFVLIQDEYFNHNTFSTLLIFKNFYCQRQINYIIMWPFTKTKALKTKIQLILPLSMGKISKTYLQVI